MDSREVELRHVMDRIEAVLAADQVADKPDLREGVERLEAAVLAQSVETRELRAGVQRLRNGHES